MVKTPRQGYVAVRRGGQVSSCIFLNWTSAEKHLGEQEAEYAVFDTLTEAETYLTAPTTSCTATKHHLSVVRKAASNSAASSADVSSAVVCNKRGLNTTTTENTDSCTKPAQAAAFALKRRKLESFIEKETVSGVVGVVSKRKPTRKWEDTFQELANTRVGDTVSIPTTLTDPKLKMWIKKQNEEYGKYCDGKESAMFEEKIQRLRSIGFTFRRDSDGLVLNDECSISSRKAIYKSWEENRQKLKTYMAIHNGSWNVDRKEDPALREWVREQQLHLQKLREGKHSNMTDEKNARLLDIGVDLPFYTWQDRIAQLKIFKENHGELNVPAKHEVLGKWVASVRRQAKTMSEGKPVKDLTPERITELQALGFSMTPDNRKDKRLENWNVEFETMFQKLQAFKEEHGDCRVMKSHTNHLELFNWVVRLRIEYKKLANSAPNTRLTAQQLLRLTDIGFPFRQKDPYKSWDARVEELRKYKEQFGSIKTISVRHPDLGEFVSRQRNEYREWCDGVKTCMTKERITILEELGFEWNTDNWKDKTNYSKPKSWSERFEELVEFKEQHGHTVVPQSTKGLGNWVHAQRLAIKAFRKGVKSYMTADKALLLSNIGFVVDARQHRNRGTGDDDTTSSFAMLRS